MEQRWIGVVVMVDGKVFEDAVWATNDHEALIVANWNWDFAESICINLLQH